MRRSYASLVHFQEGWSSLQRHSRAPRHTHRELTLQTGRLGKLQVRITSKMCSKNLQITSDCGSWVSKIIARPTIATVVNICNLQRYTEKHASCLKCKCLRFSRLGRLWPNEVLMK